MIAQIQQRIDNAIMAIADKKEKRSYLGASSLGKECDRELWYSFHINKGIDNPRVHRVMDYGHFSESYIVAMLRAAGYVVYDVDDDGKQYGFKDGIVAGNSDGVIMLNNEPYLFEAKSANDKRFKEMERLGVEKSNYVYYVQMQIYMKYLELENALYFAINKNDGSIYMEIVKYSPMIANHAVLRGKEVISKEENEVERKYKSKAFFKCKYCSYQGECWNGESSNTPEEVLSSFTLSKDFLLRE